MWSPVARSRELWAPEGEGMARKVFNWLMTSSKTSVGTTEPRTFGQAVSATLSHSALTSRVNV